MDKQISLSYLSDELAQVRTKKEEFLTRIKEIIPWGEWEAIIQPCYNKGERGNKPYALNLVLHLHILQNLFDLFDEVTSAEVIDSRAFSEFCGVEFAIVKRMFHFRKTRYRGLAKQKEKLKMMSALANLYLADKRCFWSD